MICSESKEETIGVLESLQAVCNAKADMSIGKGKILWAGYGKAAGDAIALLKEHDPVKPRVSSVEQRCGNCNKIIEMDGWKACPWCGKPILWEAVGRSVNRNDVRD